MLVKEAVALIRERINDQFDTGYSDDIIVNYINDAVKYLGGALIARNDPILTQKIAVTSLTRSPVPKNFVRLAGGFPVKREGTEFKITDGSSLVEIKFFFMPVNVDIESVMPFWNNDTYDMIVVDMACIYALNQHEYDVQQDTNLRQQLDAIIQAALGAVGNEANG